MKILLFILLQLTGTFSTQQMCLENDITSRLNKWVPSIFEINGESAGDIISTVEHHNLKEFECNISNKTNSSLTKFFFRDVHLCIMSEDRKASQIIWKFQENKIIAFFEQLYLKIDGKMVVVNGDEKLSKIITYPKLNNFTLTATTSCSDTDTKINCNTTQNSINNWSNNIWYSGNLTSEDEHHFGQEIIETLPAILQSNLNNNEELVRKLDEVFQAYNKPRKELISTYPDFLSNPHQYYYLIPRIPFLCFTLKRIVISGLSNFESYKVVHGVSEIFTHTLLIKDVQGTVTLDYGSERETDLELDFRIDYFIISKREETDCIHGQAKYYTVNKTKANVSLSDRQSEVIMNRLESALASALLSSNKAQRMCNLEMPPEDIKISNVSDWKTIKESYKEWVPFQ
ncbi:uncharacterized protein LOC135837339 [Planococcus citri]|uniref:uncharacterized protein LOC135837339 n=1 Tax=Planococcus citri TaxID=170843 RepID=UPI0031F96F16